VKRAGAVIAALCCAAFIFGTEAREAVVIHCLLLPPGADPLPPSLCADVRNRIVVDGYGPNDFAGDKNPPPTGDGGGLPEPLPPELPRSKK
jgi:hypothetical protein